MAVKQVLKSGGATALVAALAMLALPMSAQAQDRGWRGGGNASAQQGGGWRGGGDASAQQGTGGWRGRGAEGGGRSFRGEQSTPTPAPAPQAQAQQRGPSAGERSGRWQGNAGNGGDRWNRRSGGAVQNQAQTPTTPPAVTGRRGWQAGSQGTVEANRDAARGRDNAGRWRDNDGNRNERWRDNNANRDNRWRDNNANRNDRWRDNNANRNDRWRNDRNQARNWNRDWRRDDRYDWRGYRNANRGIYRLGTYHAPYRNYSYRRLTVGLFLQPLFFGSSYWIDDPWYYRLPATYGPYRWVRYYDDALLVDIYSGEVVDVIYSFFW